MPAAEGGGFPTILRWDRYPTRAEAVKAAREILEAEERKGTP